MLRLAGHVVRHASSLQAVTSLSSAEAEFYALTKGACVALGSQAFLRDWGADVPIELYSDSSSARSLAQRRGLGKQRHICTRYLWLQERLALKHVSLRVVRGTANIADLLTKALAGTTADDYINEAGLRFEGLRRGD